MADKKKAVGSILFGVAMVAFGLWQLIPGIQSCSGGHALHWGAERASRVEAGPFAIEIPSGWRNAAEANDAKMKELLAKHPGGDVLVREAFDGQTIVIQTAPAASIDANAPCDQIAAAIARGEGAASSDVVQRTLGGDRACQWTERAGGFGMLYDLRFHGQQLLLIACGGHAENTPVCEQVVTGVSVKAGL